MIWSNAMDCKEMILSEDTYDIITDFSASEFLGDDNNCYERIGEDFLILYLANLGIRNPKIDFFPYHNMPKLYGLMQLSPSGETPPGAAPFDPASLIASGITQVQRPPLSLTGQGVILCFIDTGIDYQNPVFLDEKGNSRILAIWDQTVQTGAPPDGLKYGSEYRREDINLALRSEDPYSIVPSRDENGHGSILAGVAAGSVVRQGNPYIGTALYCWAPWYLDALYGRAAIGEALGYAFLPVLLLFLVRAVGRKKGKLPQWLLLAIAISLLLQSSFAVLEVGMLLLVFCCVYYRRQLLEKDGWLTLGKAAAATLLGNLWYLLPMLRYLVAYRDVARYVGSRPFQEKGAFLLHYLTFFFQGGATYDYKSKGFQGTAAIGVGPALTGLFFFLLWLKFSGALQKKNSKEDSTAGLFWCGMLGILLSLGSFPWDLLRQNAVFQVLTFSMQSPTIFMIPAICGLTFIVCGLLNTYREEKSATEATILETAVLAVAFVSTQFLTNKLLLGRAPLWIRQKEDLPDVVLIEAPQFQMSAAAGAAQLVAVALSALGIVGIVIYCILTQKKNPARKVQKEAA